MNAVSWRLDEHPQDQTCANRFTSTPGSAMKNRMQVAARANRPLQTPTQEEV